MQEAREADLILKVIDISNPNCIEHLKTVDEILINLDLYKTPSLMVFNKIDKMDDDIFKQVKRDYPDALFLSALNSLKIDDLRFGILQELRQEELKIEMELSLNDVKSIAMVRDNCIVLNQNYNDHSVQMEFLCYKRVWNWLKQRLDNRILQSEV